MKKLLVIGLVLSMLFMLIAGCSSQKSDAEASVKTGLAVITSVAKSTDAGEEDGLARTDSVVVAVTVDDEGVIRDCFIDYVQTKINFSTAGAITTPMDASFAGKQELGDDYGMKKASGLGKEWYEQAEALAAYVTGKTIDQVKGIALSDSGAPTDADLSATVTIKIGDYIKTIEKAVANASDMGAKAGDKVGIGLVSTISHSKDATADGDGRAQSYANIVAVTVNGEGKISSCVIDAVQGNVAISAEGKITSDLSAKPMTKLELGADYGMKKASGIGKEWDEQANAFAAYVTGKTLEEVKGIAMDAEGVATDADLTSSVTIHVGPFISLIESAVGNAK